MKTRKNLNAWLAMSMFLLPMISTARARIIYVDDDGAGANNGSSWVDAYNYLQDAPVAAGLIVQWQKTFGISSSAEGSSSVQQTTDGGYIIVGNTQFFNAGYWDVYLIKTDPDGNSLWQKTFGGSGWDYGFSVQQTSDGGYIIAGETGVGEYDVYLIKTDSAGKLFWQKTFGGNDWDNGSSVQQTSDGGYIIAGTTLSFGAGKADVYLIKTDSTGKLLWQKTFGGSNWDDGTSVQQTSDGGYIIAGETKSFGPGDADVYLIKTDSAGKLQWQKTFGGSSDDLAWSVQQTTDDGYIITGETESFGTAEGNVYLIKANSKGELQWEKIFGGSDRDYGNSVQQTTDGGYIIAGATESFGAGYYDVYLIKTDSEGNVKWEKTLGGENGDAAKSVQQTVDGGYVVAGHTFSYGAGSSDVYLIKLGPRIIYVDDDAPNDPGPRDPDISDPLEDGSEAHPFDSIQEAIDAALYCDEVLVYPGIYNETIDFLGKAIMVRSAEDTAVLQAQDYFAVLFCSGEGPDSILKNFVIRNSFMAIYIENGSPTISNVTVADNAFGIAAYAGAEPDISNSIFWNNIYGDLFGCQARYSCIQEAGEGQGNLDIDPLFADPENGDYHLLSQRGRYWPEHNVWVLDDVISPCIDGGDPNADYFNEPKLNGGRVNMGAYGGTAYASMKEMRWVHSDINHDGWVNMIDLAVLAKNWLKYEPGTSNLPPEVAIIKPQDGDGFSCEETCEETIEIEADAWDSDGLVKKVEFFADSNEIGEDNDGADGWKTYWQNYTFGVHYLTTKATDDDGATATSTAVQFRIIPIR